MKNKKVLAFLYATPIGLLGGLIGLGGAEFRLPVLVGSLGYAVGQAVPLNLAISFVTLMVALVTRSSTLSFSAVAPLLPAIGGLISGAMLSAFIGVTLAGRFSEERFEQVVFVLLIAIGLALIVEGFLPQEGPGLLPSTVGWRVSTGIMFGLAIGLVSSLLGVAGGELIIPTLVFAFGADIKTAGTASLLVSIPTVAVGILRYASHGAFADRQALIETVAPMSLGSLVGGVTGGLLVGFIPSGVLKVGLGIILIVSALRIFRRSSVHRGVSKKTVFPTAQQAVTLLTTASAQDSGLLAMLVPVFEQKSGYRVKVVAVGSGQALALAAKGAGDVVLTHAPNTEKQYLMDGTVVHRRLVMHNTFLLAGPPTDPAHVRGIPKASEALKKIAEAKAFFISRGDDSGTHKLEMTLWQQAGIKPGGDWYLESKQGMGNTLRIAREKHAYVLCDRATFLASQQTPGLIALVEGDLAFLNLYHVAETNPKKHPQINTQGGKAFADFLLSADAQDRLHQFGMSKVREAFFHPDGGRTEEELQRQYGV